MTELPELRFELLEVFAAVDESGADPLASTLDGGVVIAASGVVLVYGDGGTGKTTLVLDLCFKLAAGDSWLGLVEPARPLRIALIENEGPRAEFRRKIRRKLAATGDEFDGRIVVLEEPWAELTFADEQHRRALALAATELDLDLLVIGPLVSAGEFPNGGTPAEVDRFEEHIRALRLLLDRPLALLAVHHENKSGQVSGGWGRYGDTHIHVITQRNGCTRINWQKARWASALQGTSTQLIWAPGETYSVEEKPDVTDGSLTEQIVAFVGIHPGTGWTPVEKQIHGIGNARLRALRDQLLQSGRLRNVATEDGEDVLLNAVRKRQTARLYLAEAPEVATLRPASGAALAQPAPPPSADGQLALRPAPPKEGAGGAGAAPAPGEPAEDAAV